MSSNKLSYFFETSGLNWKHLVFSPDCGTKLSHEFPLMPNDFLKFGAEDIASKSLRGYVNAISNAKRAMDCQVERVTCALGFSPSQLRIQLGKELIREIEKESPPSLLPFIYRFLASLGAFTPSLVDKVRLLRHDVEHRFQRPNRKKATEALEIATLFVRSTDSITTDIYDGFGFSNDVIDGRIDTGFRFSVEFHSPNPHVEGIYYPKGFKPGDPLQRVTILPQHPSYYWCVKMGVVLAREEDAQPVLREFIASTHAKIPRSSIRIAKYSW